MNPANKAMRSREYCMVLSDWVGGDKFVGIDLSKCSILVVGRIDEKSCGEPEPCAGYFFLEVCY